MELGSLEADTFTAFCRRRLRFLDTCPCLGRLYINLVDGIPGKVQCAREFGVANSTLYIRNITVKGEVCEACE
jgi:hypothetical protein